MGEEKSEKGMQRENKGGKRKGKGKGKERREERRKEKRGAKRRGNRKGRRVEIVGGGGVIDNKQRK